MKKNKKSISIITTYSLLLLVVVVGSVSVYKWFNNFSSEFEAKAFLQGGSSKVEILGIAPYENNSAFISVREIGPVYFIVNKILLNDKECLLLSSNIIDEISVLYLNCSVTSGENYKIDIYTDKKIISKTLTAQK